MSDQQQEENAETSMHEARDEAESVIASADPEEIETNEAVEAEEIGENDLLEHREDHGEMNEVAEAGDVVVADLSEQREDIVEMHAEGESEEREEVSVDNTRRRAGEDADLPDEGELADIEEESVASEKPEDYKKREAEEEREEYEEERKKDPTFVPRGNYFLHDNRGALPKKVKGHRLDHFAVCFNTCSRRELWNEEGSKSGDDRVWSHDLFDVSGRAPMQADLAIGAVPRDDPSNPGYSRGGGVRKDRERVSNNASTNRKRQARPTVTCYNCGEFGHLRRDCPEESVVVPVRGGQSFKDKPCYNCGELGHLMRDCPEESVIVPVKTKEISVDFVPEWPKDGPSSDRKHDGWNARDIPPHQSGWGDRGAPQRKHDGWNARDIPPHQSGWGDRGAPQPKQGGWNARDIPPHQSGWGDQDAPRPKHDGWNARDIPPHQSGWGDQDAPQPKQGGWDRSPVIPSKRPTWDDRGDKEDARWLRSGSAEERHPGWRGDSGRPARRDHDDRWEPSSGPKDPRWVQPPPQQRFHPAHPHPPPHYGPPGGSGVPRLPPPQPQAAPPHRGSPIQFRPQHPPQPMHHPPRMMHQPFQSPAHQQFQSQAHQQFQSQPHQQFQSFFGGSAPRPGGAPVSMQFPPQGLSAQPLSKPFPPGFVPMFYARVPKREVPSLPQTAVAAPSFIPGRSSPQPNPPAPPPGFDTSAFEKKKKTEFRKEAQEWFPK